MAVKRIYIERRPGFFNVLAQTLCRELKEVFNLSDLRYVRIFRRYDIDGLSDEDYSQVKNIVFSDPAVDVLYEELPNLKNDFLFAYEPLPGQYDKIADCAEQCIQIITQKEKPIIRTATVIAVPKIIGEETLQKIKNYCINKVDSRETSFDLPQSLKQIIDIPTSVETINDFTILPEALLKDLHKTMKLTMKYEDFVACQKFFRDEEKRNPTETEIFILDTYWSEHCNHRAFNTIFDKVNFPEGTYNTLFKETYEHYLLNRRINGIKDPESLMDIAKTGMRELKRQNRLLDLDESGEENACSIIVPAIVNGEEEDWLVMFKNETRNYPTEIEPFGGAATCLGGTIRDPLSGRVYVYQTMRISGCGDPRQKIEDTLEGKLPQIKIARDSAKGYSSYANQVGVATGYVKEFYHPDYVAKHLEASFSIGAAKKEDIHRKEVKPGDLIVLVGGATGRDGVRGATGSPKPEDERSFYENKAQIQKGNPLIQRKLQRLFHNPDITKLIKKCNDFGAGGIAIAIGELADGIYINLDLLETKYDGLNATELALSESQERMAVVVNREDSELFLQYCNSENISATVVATVIEEEILHIVWKNESVVDLPRKLLKNVGAPNHTLVNINMPDDKNPYFKMDIDILGKKFSDIWLENLQDINVCSQSGLVEQFDSSIGANNLLMPYGGYRQKTPAEGMAAKLPVEGGNTQTAILVSEGFDPHLAKWSPFHGGFYAVIESLAKIVAMGGDYIRARLSLQEYFKVLTEDPKDWSDPTLALLGAYLAQFSMGTAIIGGKDSMTGTFKDINVPPTIISFAVCPIETDNVISSEFKLAGNNVYVVPVRQNNLYMPDFNAVQRNFAAIRQLVENKKIYSAMTIGKGGIAATLSKMCLGENLGFRFDSGIAYELEKLFTPLYGSIIIEVSAGADLPELKNTNAYLIGKVSKVPSIVYGNDVITLEEVEKAYKKPLEEVYPTQIIQPKSNMSSRTMANNDIGLKAEKVFSMPRYDITLTSNRNYNKAFPVEYHSKKILKGSLHLAQPRVFIPVFPGTSCEYDMENAFLRAGAIVDMFIFKNLSLNAIEASLDYLAKKIRTAQIVALPGGYSGGDSPDGNGKFIVSAFRNEKVADAINSFLYQKDGLMLGICNGFQALLKLGLLPYGHICETTVDSPTLSYNEIGHYISRVVQTKMVSDLSPWFSQMEFGHLSMVPISHEEGRFCASSEVLAQLRKNGQIATQYVDSEGNVSMDREFNPNGSVDAIEGITSPDGRILGKMGHNERSLNGLSINVLRDQEQLIFKSGVEYFR